MSRQLYETVPKVEILLKMPVEELGALVLACAPGVMQNQMFNISDLTAGLYSTNPAQPSYPPMTRSDVTLVIGEALAWLSIGGYIFQDPGQPAVWYRLTRKARAADAMADLTAYAKSHILPPELLHQDLHQHTLSLFRQGKYDLAVFEAFKRVEVAVRTAAKLKQPGFDETLTGDKLMRRAFHEQTGALTDISNPSVAERESDAHLFAGAMAHARNPVAHRDPGHALIATARLLIVASYLLSVVDQRK
jgi:uncharacterized protein (TIGR02391 family)